MPERTILTWRLHRALGRVWADGVVNRNAVTRPILLWFWLFVMGATAGAQERPRVVQTFPENGATAVDPATTELRVVFDQPMGHGVSFVRGGPTFPELAGQPYWTSATTVVLPIRLEPDRTYWVSINSDRYQNFRGVNGLPAIPYPISFRTAPSAGTGSLGRDVNLKSVTQLKAAVEDRYSHRDLRDIDWDARFAEFESQLIDAKTPGAFAFLAGQLLEAARDIHIFLKVGDEILPSFRRSVRPNADFDLIKRQVPGFQAINDLVATGRFPDGPAYLKIDTWHGERAEDIAAAGAPILAAMAWLILPTFCCLCNSTA